MKIQRITALLGVSLTAVAVLAGCATAADSGKPTIGVTLNAASNPFFLAEGKAIEEAAAEAGVEVSVQYANADVAVQSDQIDTFIRKKVDSIIVDAVDSDGVGPAVLRATQANIPVVAIDVAAPGAAATVTSDNVQAGRDSCAYLFDQLGGKGKVAIVDGSAVSAISDRMDGCRQAIEKTPGIEIVATQRADLTRDKSMNVASNILTAHPDIQGFFGVNDPTAVGISLAAQQRGSAVKVVGVDGAQQLTDLIGQGHIIGTSGQDPAKLGRTGLDLAVKLANGEQVSSEPQRIPTFLVTAETIGDYQKWG
ncbi:sugar ABC transporter substrate-binding protein [Mycolicibacterium wolinskyi]|uniref:Sugar ABC transporter substrate-binding protein n=1 Tax=Mycolicibacterium wolinskyi TaxID=59750 RepID=A0A132PJX4_9MYCO|nr:sugar ABC transporter substrate-binding protein [Mycolicibacterium wolinskyi]